MKTKILIILIAIICLGAGGFFVWKNISIPEVEKEKSHITEKEEKTTTPSEEGEKAPVIEEPMIEEEVVEEKEKVGGEVKTGYKYVTEKPTGWFKTGQEADIVLGPLGFNDSGGPSVLNHPGKVATDGQRLIVSDTWNHRVLIWNQIPTQNNTPPDLVLGQKNFDTNYAGLAADKMNWPMGAATNGEKLLVADTYNNRILIWNSFPTKNGQPADLVLGVDDFETRYSEFGERNKRTFIDNPWDVWTDGNKVISSGGPVLIWNTFPTYNNQPADLILGLDDFSARFTETQEDFPTPRGIASDGKRLALGTYEPQRIFIYNDFPTQNGQDPDFFLALEHWGAMGLGLKNDKLFAISHSRFYIWNNFPAVSQKADIEYEPRRTSEQIILAPDKIKLYPDQIGYGYGITVSNNKLIIADTNNNRILIFNKIPTETGQEADVILGRPEIYLSRSSFGSGPKPHSDGQRLFVGNDYGIRIYNNLPDESKASADIVLGLNIKPDHGVVGGRVTTIDEKLFMLHRSDKSTVFIWNKIPDQDNQKPDASLGGRSSIGRGGMHEASDIGTDGNYLFIADTGNNRVLVWDPNKQEADFVLGQNDFESSEPNFFNYLSGLDTDGKHLAVADMENQRVLIWKLPIVKNGQTPDFIIKDMGSAFDDFHFNLPQDVEVYGDRLFVADGGSNRILIWNKFADTKPDIVLGQKSLFTFSPSNTKDRLFAPVSLSFDGSFLWVGEVKYSERLLRFSVQP